MAQRRAPRGEHGQHSFSSQRKPIPKSALNGSDLLFVAGSATFDCGHMREVDFDFHKDHNEDEVMELSDLAKCPKKSCRCRGVAHLFNVASGDMLSMPVGDCPIWDIQFL